MRKSASACLTCIDTVFSLVARTQFARLDSVHVYSLAPSPIRVRDNVARFYLRSLDMG